MLLSCASVYISAAGTQVFIYTCCWYTHQVLVYVSAAGIQVYIYKWNILTAADTYTRCCKCTYMNAAGMCKCVRKCCWDTSIYI